MRPPCSLLVLSATLLLAVCPLSASAEGSDAALATELFNAGRDLMKDGNFAAACPKLAESARLDGKVGTFARLAECEEKLGHMVAARGHWQQATNLARAQNDARLTHVEEEFARVDKVVPKVNVVLDGRPPSGLSLRLDGVEIGEASVGLALPVDAGSHAIVVGADGKKPFAAMVSTLADGAVVVVHVPPFESGALLPVSLSPPSAPSAVAAPVGYWTPLRKVGVTTLGVGAATLAVGAVFGVLAKVKLDDSNSDGCAGGVCRTTTGYDERNAAYSDGTISTALFIAGGVVAAAGVSVLFLAPSKREGAAPAAAVIVGPGSILARGAF
jgi:hypothetical protein